ncbi:MAG: hypothetical protein ACYC6W_08325 [Nitrosotalea sp.]
MTTETDFENFKTVREEFSEFTLSDGNVLRVKDVLVSFAMTPQKIESDKMLAKISMQVQPVGGVIYTGKSDTSKLEFVTGIQVSDQDKISKLDFEPKNLVINVYETNGFLILLKSKLLEVWTTRYKDKNDAPIYRFYSSAVMDLMNKKEVGEPHDGVKTVTVNG